MPQLSISYQANYQNLEGNLISDQMNSLPKHILEFAPWKEFPYKPKVHFAIAHSNDFIFLKFYVEEKEIRNQITNINGNVWEDSCVEFFISFDEISYYNFEFNNNGIGLVGYGSSKQSRLLVDESVVKKIKTHSKIENTEIGYKWVLLLQIPIDVFTYNHFSTLRNKIAKANFYKCGDTLQDPHFIAWSYIDFPTPNFHLPQYFGTIKFE